MARATITEFLFQDGDYFTAHTDQNGVRIGMVGGTCYDIPNGHAFYERIVEATSRAEVEEHHDDLTGASLARRA